MGSNYLHQLKTQEIPLKGKYWYSLFRRVA